MESSTYTNDKTFITLRKNDILAWPYVTKLNIHIVWIAMIFEGPWKMVRCMKQYDLYSP